jgi:hypothetical protein
MAILFTFFSLFGVLAIVAGRDVGGRLSGVTILLVFGFGGFAYLSGPAMTRRGPATVRSDRLETSAGSEPAFVFPSPSAKRRAIVIGLGGIAVGTVGMLALTGGGPLLIAGTVLLCLIFIWSLMSLRRPQLLALTPTRVVVVLPSGAVEVPWEAGVDAEIYPMPSGQATVDMVGVVATDPAAATWSRGRAIGRVNRRLSRYVVSIGADSFAGEGEDVVAAIRHYAAEPDARRRIGGTEEHGRLLRVLGETAPEAEVAGLGPPAA